MFAYDFCVCVSTWWVGWVGGVAGHLYLFDLEFTSLYIGGQSPVISFFALLKSSQNGISIFMWARISILLWREKENICKYLLFWLLITFFYISPMISLVEC